MAAGTATAPVDDWKDVPAPSADDWHDVPANSGTKIQDSSTIAPEGKTDWTGSAPLSDWVSRKIAPIENYTEAGRKEHPILATIGDVLRKSPITLPRQQAGQIYDSPIPVPGGGGIGVLEEEAPAAAMPTPRPEPAPTPAPSPSPIMQASIRRGPGEILPERVGAPEPAMRIPAIAQRGGNSELPGGGVIQRPPAGLLTAGGPPEAPPVPKASIRDVAKTVVDKNIPPEPKLTRNVPLGQQPRGTPGSTAAMDVRESFGARAKAPEKLPTAITEEVSKQAGAPPLKENVSLRENIKNPDLGAESKQARLERMYPDKGIRQLVHIVGEDMAQAIGGDAKLMREAADLRKVDVSRAASVLGEDLKDVNISSRKASGDVRPQEMLSRLLKKGHTPPEIIAAARAPLPEH